MTKFHVDRAKIVDFLLLANFGTCIIFFYSVFKIKLECFNNYNFKFHIPIFEKHIKLTLVIKICIGRGMKIETLTVIKKNSVK